MDGKNIHENETLQNDDESQAPSVQDASRAENAEKESTGNATAGGDEIQPPDLSADEKINAGEPVPDMAGAVKKKRKRKKEDASAAEKEPGRLQHALMQFFSDPRLKAVLPCILIALCVLAGTLFLNLGINKAFHTPGSEDVTQITEWKFVWGDTEKSIEGDFSKWLLATKSKPIKKQAGENFLRLRYTVQSSAKSTILRINADNAPCKITVDGEEIYNNHYTEASYVGGSSNIVNIEPSGDEQVIDVYLYVPFAATVSGSLSTPESTMGLMNFRDYSGIVFGTAITLVGLLLLLISIFLSLRNKHLEKLLLLGVTIACCGGTLIVNELSSKFAVLTESLFFNLKMFLGYLIVQLMILIIVECYGYWSKPLTCTMVSMFALSLLVLFIPSAIALKVLSALFLVPLLAAFALLALKIGGTIQRGIQFVKISAVAFCCVLALKLFDTVCFVFDLKSPSPYLVLFGLITFCMINFIIFYRTSIDVNVRKKERESQIEENGKTIKDITSVISQIFIQNTVNEFLVTSAQGLCSLVVSSLESEEISPDAGEIKKQEEIHYCIAVLDENKAYKEIYNHGSVQNCSYDSILKNSVEAGKRILFAKSYFDLLLSDDTSKSISCIIHFENIASALSGNLENIILTAFSNIEIAYDNLVLKNEFALSQERIFIALAETVETRSSETSQHLKCVSQITKVLCRELGMSAYECRLVSSASMVHDVGKIAISESILNKAGPLTDAEYKKVKEHVIYGYNILSKSGGDFMNAAAVIAQQHHEHIDGNGYLGLHGNEIHLFARIVAVSDVFDALMTKRCYKDDWSPEDAFRYINEGSGTQFDPEIVQAFNRCKDELVRIKQTLLVKE